MTRQLSRLRAAGTSLLTGLALLAWTDNAASQERRDLICETVQGTRQVHEQQIDDCKKIIGFEVEQGRTINRYDIGLSVDNNIQYISELGIPLRDPNTDRFTRFARSLDMNDDEFVVPSHIPGTNTQAEYIIFRVPDEHQRIRFDEGIHVESVTRNIYRISMDNVLSTYRKRMPDRDVFEVQGMMYRTDCDTTSVLGVKLLVSDLPVIREDVPYEVERIVERFVEVPVDVERVVNIPIVPQDTLWGGLGAGVKLSLLRAQNHHDVCLNGIGPAAMMHASYRSPSTRFNTDGNISIRMNGCDPRDEDTESTHMQTMALRADLMVGQGLAYGAFLDATHVSAEAMSRSMTALGAAVGFTKGAFMAGGGPVLAYTTAAGNGRVHGGAGMVLHAVTNHFRVGGRVWYYYGDEEGGGASITANSAPVRIGGARVGVHGGVSRYALCGQEDTWYTDSAFVGVTLNTRR